MGCMQSKPKVPEKQLGVVVNDQHPLDNNQKQEVEKIKMDVENNKNHVVEGL